MWTLQNTKGSIPAPRQNAASTSLGTKFYVHGGRGGGLMLDDLHVLETVGFTWSRVIYVKAFAVNLQKSFLLRIK